MADSIRPRGNSLQVRVSAGLDPTTGKQRWLSETVKGTGKSSTERAVRVRKRLRAEAEELKAAPPVVDTSMTTGEALDKWLEASGPALSPNSLNTSRVAKDHYLKALRDTPLASLTVEAIEDHYVTLRNSGVPGQDEPRPLAPSTIRRAHGVLHRALNYATRRKWVAVNVASAAEPPEAKRIARKMPDAKLIQSLLDFYATKIPELALAIWLLAITGARRGEVVGLRWSDVDIAGRSLLFTRAVAMEIDDEGHERVVVNPVTKTGESRRIGIDQRTADLLKTHLETCQDNAELFGVELTEDDYLFSDGPGSATPWRPARITRAFIRARDDLAKKGAKGIKNVRLGDLRHYSASQLLANGWDPLAVSTRLGNSPRTLLANYSHYIPADDHAAADHMAGLFRAK